MTKLRTRFTSASMLDIGHIAGVEDYQVALPTYRAALSAGQRRTSPCGRPRV